MITQDILKSIDTHWAVKAVGDKALRDKILLHAQATLVKNEIGKQLTLNLTENSITDDDIHRLATAYEMLAIEGMRDFINHTDNNTLQDQFLAGSYRAFELHKTLQPPEDNLQFILYLLHLSSLAYCGDCWTDLKTIYKNHDSKIKALLGKEHDNWDEKILFQLFNCWVHLFKKDTWNDLNNIAQTIVELRNEQEQFEKHYLDNDTQPQGYKTLRLISLYHWARTTELLAQYMLQGEPADIKAQTDRHFSMAIKIAGDVGDAQLEILLRWLQAASEQMISGSIWWIAQTINSKATEFIKELANRSKPMLELLTPQRIAIKEQGLLDPAKTAVVVDMPTSGGKTLLAQFKMLQAINNFGDSKGWIAYIAPTKALVAQITRRLRQDFSPIGITVEKLSGALEIDVLEEDLLEAEQAFDILVATPEKMQLVLRNRKIARPLSLFVMDEAHNIEGKTRGLRIELLLATVKQHYQSRANFLLLMPYVPNADTLSRWLAHDRDAGLSISLSTIPWKPNERIIGLVKKEQAEGSGNWSIKYETLVTTPKTIHLKGEHKIGGIKPINVTKSKANPSKLAAGCAKVFSDRGTSIVIATKISYVWSIAKTLSDEIPDLENISLKIKLVQNFLKAEVSPDFELINMLNKGIGVHHSKLSDEIKALMEWLVEKGELKVLCATTTIAQGINFPVSSIFLQSIEYPYGVEMSYREFWNLAGRAGRIGQENIGVIGIACDDKYKARELTKYVTQNTENLISQLVNILTQLDDSGKLNDLEEMWKLDDLQDFRCYIAHLLNEKKDLQATLNDMDQMLTNTFGYNELKANKPIWADKLLEATKKYTKSITEIDGWKGRVAQADITGFSVESIHKVNAEVRNLEFKLTSSDWMPKSLFGDTSSKLPDIFKVMFEIRQLDFKHDSKQGQVHQKMANIAKDWIAGKTITEIANTYYQDSDRNKGITQVYDIIYKKLLYGGTWGVSALSQITGVDFDALNEYEKRQINLMPAMMYHGVNNEESVLMRLNSVPRSLAKTLGENFKIQQDDRNISTARKYLKSLTDEKWQSLTNNQFLSGKDCKEIWQILSGEKGLITNKPHNKTTSK